MADSGPEEEKQSRDGGSDKEGSSNSGQSSPPRLLSAEDLDSLIFEHDPELLQAAAEFAKIGDIPEGELIDLDRAYEEERQRSIKFRLKVGFSKIIYKIEFTSLSLVRHSRDFLMVRLPMLARQILMSLKLLLKRLQENLQAFLALPKKQKIAAGALLLLIVLFVGFLRYLLSGHSFLNPSENKFVLNLENVAEQKMEFDPATDMELFFDSPRIHLSQVLLGRIVVNLKSSAKSRSPMLAIELIIETLSEEIAIEIKDREPEIKDIISRKIEELSFENIDSQTGKVLLLERLRDELNRKLDPGAVRKVRIKTIVLKS